MSATCDHCGSRLRPSDTLCPKCLRDRPTSSREPIAEADPYPADPAPRSSGMGGFMKLLLGVYLGENAIRAVIGCALLALMGVAAAWVAYAYWLAHR